MTTKATEQARIDQWLWAVRLAKTRAAAKAMCTKGQVRLNGEVAKAAKRVSVADRVVLRRSGITYSYEVKRLLTKRVSAQIAQDCYEDLTSVEELQKLHDRRRKPADRIDAAWAERERGTGRPTKKQRREMERFLGRKSR